MLQFAVLDISDRQRLARLWIGLRSALEIIFYQSKKWIAVGLRLFLLTLWVGCRVNARAGHAGPGSNHNVIFKIWSGSCGTSAADVYSQKEAAPRPCLGTQAISHRHPRESSWGGGLLVY